MRNEPLNQADATDPESLSVDELQRQLAVANHEAVMWARLANRLEQQHDPLAEDAGEVAIENLSEADAAFRVLEQRGVDVTKIDGYYMNHEFRAELFGENDGSEKC